MDATELKQTCKEYAELKQEISGYESSVSDKISPLMDQIKTRTEPLRQQAIEIKEEHAPKLKEMTDKLSALGKTIKKELKEQAVLDDGTKVNVQNNRKLNVKKELAFYNQLGEQAKGCLESVKFNFAQCGIKALVDAKVLKLNPEIAEFIESKSVTVKYPKK